MPDHKPTLEYERPDPSRGIAAIDIATSVLLAVGMLSPAILEGLAILHQRYRIALADLIALGIFAASGLFMLWLTWTNFRRR